MIVDKIRQLYSNEPVKIATHEDPKYERIMTSFDRIKKSLTHQYDSLVEVD